MQCRLSFALLAFLCITPVYADVSMPKIFADNMVLQRHEPIKIWGWAKPFEKISVSLGSEIKQTTADNSGHWSIILPAQLANSSTQLTIKGLNTLSFDNVAIGEVWLASGQSNMQHQMAKIKAMFPAKMTLEDYPDIRQFKVENDYNYKREQQEFTNANWQLTNKSTIGQFSAVAWFFAKEIAMEQGVTVGILNASVGNTQVQSWMSAQALMAFPEDLKRGLLYRDDKYIKQKEYEAKQAKQIKQKWLNEVNLKDLGLNNKTPWYNDIDVSDWQELNVPGQVQYQNIDFRNGVIWLKKTFHLKDSQIRDFQVKENTKLILGKINDFDTTYVNGIKVGGINNRWRLRDYKIPAKVLRAGKNTVTVRVTTLREGAGTSQTEPYQIQAGSNGISLRGKWLYKVGVKSKALPRIRPTSWHPTGHYNAMIAPLLPFSLKGVIWYQGETNSLEPYRYQALFSSMINNWRRGFNKPELPFLFVQLANFMKKSSQPEESAWAMVRSAQNAVNDALAYTGMATAIDVGEWNEIHPLDKQTVGKRLALAAKAIAYQQPIVYQNPQLARIIKQGNKLLLTIKYMTGKPIVKGELSQSFAIAGSDGHFQWASVELIGDNFTVWHPDIPNPKVVRYAWANNPNTPVYNSNNLPLLPFSYSMMGK